MFTWIVQVLATADLVKGKTIGIDVTTLEANAALRSIVRRDSGKAGGRRRSNGGVCAHFLLLYVSAANLWRRLVVRDDGYLFTSKTWRIDRWGV